MFGFGYTIIGKIKKTAKFVTNFGKQRQTVQRTKLFTLKTKKL